MAKASGYAAVVGLGDPGGRLMRRPMLRICSRTLSSGAMLQARGLMPSRNVGTCPRWRSPAAERLSTRGGVTQLPIANAMVVATGSAAGGPSRR
jgi:hypothetical protein